MPGDVSRDGLGLDDDGRAALAAADVVIHSAATVSFDAPLTQAVEINLLGPSRVAAAIAETGSTAHLVAVSTAYVASTHQGEAKEELLSENRFTLDVPWKTEVSSARRLRDDLEAESRRPEKLRGFTKQARAEIGAAGDHLIAAKAEKLLEEWVNDRAGDRRHGTCAVARMARRLSLHQGTRRACVGGAVGRPGPHHAGAGPPSLSLRWPEPRPGWIRGFRMAEPIIVSYARGLLA